MHLSRDRNLKHINLLNPNDSARKNQIPRWGETAKNPFNRPSGAPSVPAPNKPIHSNYVLDHKTRYHGRESSGGGVETGEVRLPLPQTQQKRVVRRWSGDSGGGGDELAILAGRDQTRGGQKSAQRAVQIESEGVLRFAVPNAEPADRQLDSLLPQIPLWRRRDHLQNGEVYQPLRVQMIEPWDIFELTCLYKCERP